MACDSEFACHKLKQSCKYLCCFSCILVPLLIVILGFFNNYFVDDELYLDRDYAGVRLSSNVQLSEKSLKTMSPLVSTIFIEDTEQDGEMRKIPMMIAQHNAYSSQSSKKMTIIATFSNANSSFEITKDLLDSANDVYPGTGDTLVFLPNFDEHNAVIQEIRNARDTLNSSVFNHRNYKLGVILHLDKCSWEQFPFGPALRYVDVVILNTKVSHYQSRSRRRRRGGSSGGRGGGFIGIFVGAAAHGAYRARDFRLSYTVSRTVAHIASCERRLMSDLRFYGDNNENGNRTLPKIQIIPMVECEPISGSTDMSGCWMEMNNWARREKKTVIFTKLAEYFPKQ